MIPGLLHGRLLSGGGGSGVVSSPGYPDLFPFQSKRMSATAQATFTLNPDGTWGTTGTGSAVVSNTHSGNWYLPTTGGIGAGYEVKITPTKNWGADAVISSDAADWVAISSARQLVATLSRYSLGTSDSSYNVRVQIRIAGGGVIVSDDTFEIQLSADVFETGGV